MEIEGRSVEVPLALEVRENKPVIRGTASVFFDGTAGTEYQLAEGVYERIAPGAFDGWLASDPDCLCLAHHDRKEILARTPDTLKVWSDGAGLHYEAVLPETTYARDLVALISHGTIRGSSFGFLPRKSQWVKDGGKDVRLITEAVVDHVSPVVRPAYRNTSVALRERDRLVNQEETEKRVKMLEEVLRGLKVLS